MNKNDLRKVRDALAKSAEHLDSPPAYVIATVAILDAELAADPQPVGVYLGKKDDDCGEREECLTWNPIPVGTKLYTAPPSREWKGLSDDERQSCKAKAVQGFLAYVRLGGQKPDDIGVITEAALRAKNEVTK